MNAKTSDECEACAHCVDGECRATSGKPEYGECGHYEGCTGFAQRRDETVREVCAEMREHSSGDASETYYDRFAWEVLIDRILAAHERELAAKDAEKFRLECECIELRDQLAAKDAEIARLKAALKPVMECDVSQARKFSVWHAAFNSVSEAHRIVGAWDDKNYFDEAAQNRVAKAITKNKRKEQ